ncbi:MAG: thermonuclease family protein [Sulfuritalea sp.]|nr:thermonuclease family protein [Thiobacillus sp.]MDP1980934.1 thermonuclease family protein [Sulfuritalea sp.]
MSFPAFANLLRCLALGCLLSAPVAWGESLQGTVIEVTEGDIVIVADDHQTRYKIRLAGIDAPEPRQAFGQQSRKSLAKLVLNKKVSIERRKEDNYGRVVARVMVQPHGCISCARTRDAGLAQLEAGLAWWYREERREQPLAEQGYYEYAEFDAHARRIGLWADATPLPPWEWRKRNNRPFITLLTPR